MDPQKKEALENAGWKFGNAEDFLGKGSMIIYQTRFNSDMTEGRGPMVNGPAFLDRKEAEIYIDKQTGVMGRKAKWSLKKGGDWCIDEVKVFATSKEVEDDDMIKAKKKAMSKLTTKEIEALRVLGLE